MYFTTDRSTDTLYFIQFLRPTVVSYSDSPYFEKKTFYNHKITIHSVGCLFDYRLTVSLKMFAVIIAQSRSAWSRLCRNVGRNTETRDNPIHFVEYSHSDNRSRSRRSQKWNFHSNTARAEISSGHRTLSLCQIFANVRNRSTRHFDPGLEVRSICCAPNTLDWKFRFESDGQWHGSVMSETAFIVVAICQFDRFRERENTGKVLRSTITITCWALTFRKCRCQCNSSDSTINIATAWVNFIGIFNASVSSGLSYKLGRQS